MDRREFLKRAVASSAAMAISAAGAVQGTVSVTDFGADPRGQADSTSAVRSAAQAAMQRNIKRLVFPRGTYRVASASAFALGITGKNELEIDGNSSRLVMGADALAIMMDKCSHILVRDLIIDWFPLPFVQGTVSSSGIGWCEITLDPGFSIQSIPSILSVDAYSRSLRNFDPMNLSIPGAAVFNSSFSKPGVLRIMYKSLAMPPKGTPMVVRFHGGHDAIRITNSDNITFSNVHLLASPMMGYNIATSSNLQFESISIGFETGSTRLLSTNADGMHITNCSGTLNVENCIFQGMGDDAININATMWRAHHAPTANQAMLFRAPGIQANAELKPKSNDDVEVLDPKDMHVIAHAQADRIPVPEDAIIAVANRIPQTRITGCKFPGNRSRAVLGHANMTIQRNEFNNTSLAAVLLAPDSYWMEGPATENIVIDSNSFSGCHYASNAEEGTIAIDVEQTASRRKAVSLGEGRNVSITNNSLTQCHTAAISCRSVDKLVLEGNQIGVTWNGNAGRPAIILEEITNGSVTRNSASPHGMLSVRQCSSTSISNNPGFTVSS